MHHVLTALLAATPLTTTAEASGFERTGRYAEVEALCAAFEQRAPGRVRCAPFGTTPLGRPMLHLVASDDGVLTPEAARARRRPVVFFQGGIHAGEIDGKDAGLMLLRDLLDYDGTIATLPGYEDADLETVLEVLAAGGTFCSEVLAPLNGRQVHAHEGGTGGFSSMVAFDREAGRGVVVLSDTALHSLGGLGGLGLHLLDPTVPLGGPRREQKAPAELLDALAGGPRTVDELVAAVYAAVPRELWPAAAQSTRATLAKLVAEDRVEPADGAAVRLA